MDDPKPAETQDAQTERKKGADLEYDTPDDDALSKAAPETGSKQGK